jgi:hypothetical protein
MTARRKGWIALGLAGAVTLGACDGGPDRTDAAVPAVRAAAQGPDASASAAAGPALLDAVASPPADAADAHPALFVVGEIELPAGRVERAYRVRLDHPGAALPAATVELVGVPPGVEIVRGRLEFDDLPDGTSVLPAQTVTLRHAADTVLRPADLKWRWQGGSAVAARAGRLLAGEPAAPAVDALAAWSVQGAARSARLAAWLDRAATVGDVNTALRQAGVDIVEMRPGNHRLTLRPRGGDDRVLAQAAAVLQASAVFLRVDRLPAEATAMSAGSPAPDMSAVPDAQAAENDAAADAACDT